MGPEPSAPGRQQYEANNATLVTSWDLSEGSLELTDAMAWPWNDRHGNEGGPSGRVILRRLRCTQGAVQVRLDYLPRDAFSPLSSLYEGERGLTTWFDGQPLTRDAGLVRLIVPSETDDALRQVKWISHIEVRS